MRLNTIGIILFVSFNVAAYEYKVENNTPRPIKVRLEVGLPGFTDSQEFMIESVDSASKGIHVFKFKGGSAGYCFRSLSYKDTVTGFTETVTKKARKCGNMHFIIQEKLTENGDKVVIQ